MTEDKAREKWCPMARFHVIREKYVYDNKPDKKGDGGRADDESTSCIGSDCALWFDEGDALDGVRLGRCGLINK